MKSSHVDKNSKSIKNLMFIVVVFALFCAFAAIFCNAAISWAGYDFVMGNNSTNDNYATKEYWNQHYGPHDDKYVSLVNPGTVLGADGATTDYFININSTILAGTETTTTTPGIIIKGTVNLYFEKNSDLDFYPTLTIKGSDTTYSAGAGAGIQLSAGNTLNIRGRGNLDIQGGSCMAKQFASDVPQDGGTGWITDHTTYVDSKSGAGGNGAEGFGGSAPAIGSNGAKGGSAGAGGAAASCRDWFVIDDSTAGNNGSAGGDGYSSDGAGTLVISGDFNTIFKSGTSSVPEGFWQSRSGLHDYCLWNSGRITFVGAGASGAYGGLGFAAPELGIGSGGAGGGGGGGGGSGNCEYAKSGPTNQGQASGGGGSPGGSYLANNNIRSYTAGDCFWCSDKYTTQAENGKYEIIENPEVLKHRQYGLDGGSGAAGDGWKSTGSGGKGGNSGLSGAAGMYFSTVVRNSLLPTGEADYAVGKDSSVTRCFPTEDCTASFRQSIVDWCLAYVLNEPEVIAKNILLNHVPSGEELISGTDFTINGITEQAGVEQTISASPCYDVNGKPTLTKPDMQTPSQEFTTNLWLVNKGVVYIDAPESFEKTYDSKTVDLVEISDFHNKAAQDIKDEIRGEGLLANWYDISSGQRVLLPGAPNGVGTYEVDWTVKGANYIGNKWRTTKVTILSKDLSIEVDNVSKMKGMLDPNFTITTDGLCGSESLVEGVDYSFTREPGEEANTSYKISISLLQSSTTLKNYSTTTTEGYLYITMGIAFARVGNVEVTYGDEFNESKLYIASAYTIDEGEQIELHMEKGKDFNWVCKPGKDVGSYVITAKLIYEENSLATQYSFVMTMGQYVIKPLETPIYFSPEDMSKVYGDPNPEVSLDFDTPLLTGDKLELNEDYTVNIFDWKSVGTQRFSVEIIPDGPVSKNYANLTPKESATYTVNKRPAQVWANPAESIYGEPDAPLTIDCDGLVYDEVLKPVQDYKVSREPGIKVDTYDINVEIVEDGPVAKNYDFQVTGSTYTILKASTTISADIKTITYGEKDPELTCTVGQLQYSDVFTKGTDYSVSRFAGEATGVYLITPQVIENENTNNYEITINIGYLYILPFTDMRHAIFSEIEKQIYTGEEITPDFTLTYNFPDYTKVFEEGKDFTCKYSNNVNVGCALIEIRGMGSCTGASATTFIIDGKEASMWCDDITATYGEADKELTVNVEGLVDGDELTEGLDYVIARTPGNDCGTYTIIAWVTPDGPVSRNYKITSTNGTYTITKFDDFDKVMVANVPPIEYTGQPICPKFDVSYNFETPENFSLFKLLVNEDNVKKFDEGKDYTVTYENNIEPGIATATLTGTENCEGVKQVNFEILPAGSTSAQTSDYNISSLVAFLCLISIISFCVYFKIRKQMI